jgi:hypothetical protein
LNFAAPNLRLFTGQGLKKMRKPAQVESWRTPEELLPWLKEAPTVEAYQKRLVVWLTYLGPFHAQEVAKMLGVSKQAVWLWLGQYNKSVVSGKVIATSQGIDHLA